MKLNTNSNIYTFVYMTVVVIIVAVLLALANQSLKPRQEANILLDKQKQILGALKVDYSAGNPAEIYMVLVNDTLTYGDKEVYVANLNGETKYILPLSGKGSCRFPVRVFGAASAVTSHSMRTRTPSMV